MSTASYQSALSSRYASQKMLRIFSADNKYQIWRRLWLALAEAQQTLGLKISEEQIKELRENLEHIDYKKVAFYEKEFRHDVMAHIHAFGDLCPKAKSIIHLGATSCYVTDNGDLIQYREALEEIRSKLTQVIRNFTHIARKYEGLPCLAYTHFQPAQPTTLGKRICLWLQNFAYDYAALNRLIEEMPFLGIKGATGTQASLLALFHNNPKTVESCDLKIAKTFHFKNLLRISGQTYPRKIDLQITQVLTQIAVSASKFGSDLRLLSHLGECEESSLSSQIGSSAMPYKKNPIYSERICSLARFLKNLSHNAEDTASQQWLERSLDDSANKRLALPECFLTADAILKLLLHLSSELTVSESVIQRNLQRELPFLATENILMALVKKGGNRQELHEKLRVHSNYVRKEMKENGAPNNLIERILNDSSCTLTKNEINELLDIKKFTGRAEEQVRLFLESDIQDILKNHESSSSSSEELSL